MSLITRMYRARLGVGLSHEVKKTPAVVFRPGLGRIKLLCCDISRKYPPITVTFDTPNNQDPFTFNNNPFIYTTYTTPPLPTGFSWSTTITLYSQDLTTQTITKTYSSGQTFAIYLGVPGTFVNIFGNIIWVVLAGGTGIFETFSNGNPNIPLLTSNGGNYSNTSPYVRLVLTIIRN